MDNTGFDYPLISIIVPVYKVEKYLRGCIDSIVAQTYQNMEVFLVDDGSPDNCGAICDEYAEQYPFIHVIHQTNQGQAAARNNAVKLSKGSFIAFVDSDDYVEPDYLEYLYVLQQKYKADMAIGGFGYFYEGSTPKRNSVEEKEEVLGACEALIRMNYNRGFGAMPWAKLFKRDLIVRHPFPEGQIYEDLAVMYKIVGDCGSIALGNRKVYYWLQRAGSTMRREFDDRQMAGMDAAAAQIRYVEERFPDALDSAKYRFTAKAVELIAVCFNSGGSKMVFSRLKKEMCKYANNVLRDNLAKKSMKIRIISVLTGYYSAKLVFSAHEKAKKTLV